MTTRAALCLLILPILACGQGAEIDPFSISSVVVAQKRGLNLLSALRIEPTNADEVLYSNGPLLNLRDGQVRATPPPGLSLLSLAVAPLTGRRIVTGSSAPSFIAWIEGQAVKPLWSEHSLQSPSDLALHETAQELSIFVVDRNAMQLKEENALRRFILPNSGAPRVEPIAPHPEVLGHCPVGLALGGGWLYVSYKSPRCESTAGTIVRYPISEDGAAGQPQSFARVDAPPEGLATDTTGRVYVATATGVRAFRENGTPYPTELYWPVGVRRLSFGGERLYFTTEKDICSTNLPGVMGRS